MTSDRQIEADRRRQEHRRDDGTRQTAFALQCCEEGLGAVERELVLRLASLLWRLRRAATERTGLYDIQADHPSGLWRFNPVRPTPHLFVYALFERRTLSGVDEVSTSAERFGERTVDFARCFLRLSNLPNYAFDVSADMRQPCGARLLRTPYIVVSHRMDGIVTQWQLQKLAEVLLIPQLRWN
jgi:hypothetical protein